MRTRWSSGWLEKRLLKHEFLVVNDIYHHIRATVKRAPSLQSGVSEWLQNTFSIIALHKWLIRSFVALLFLFSFLGSTFYRLSWLITWKPFHIDLYTLGHCRTLIGSHTLQVDRYRYHAALITGSAWNHIWHVLTSAVSDAVITGFWWWLLLLKEVIFWIAVNDWMSDDVRTQRLVAVSLASAQSQPSAAAAVSLMRWLVRLHRRSTICWNRIKWRTRMNVLCASTLLVYSKINWRRTQRK